MEKIMLKKLCMALAVLAATMGFAYAEVDVNKADQAALDGINGIGPAISKRIIEERKKGGNFKDWADFENRVKGIGEKTTLKLSQAGLVVNGKAKPDAPVAKEDKSAQSTQPKVKTAERAEKAKNEKAAAGTSASVLVKK